MASPTPWGLSIADGDWKYRKTLAKQSPQVGMIHFNGGNKSNDALFFVKLPNFLDENVVKSTFRMAKYFLYMPWTWARFQAASMIREGLTVDAQQPPKG